ncbi:PH domain-containing protein [Patescibacteria group bacterium]|nr:MAG: PH domain-containing protein [Patescibacteria group bacterium]
MPLLNIIHQKPYEQVKATVRRHPITFVPYVFWFIVLLAVPAGIYWLMGALFPNLLASPTATTVAILAASVYLLSVCLFFYSHFVAFYLDMWIITNDRLVDIRQISLFARTISEVDLYQIQDITSEVHGMLASIFNYGNVILQTAGPVPKFIIYNAPRPHKLREQLILLAAEDRKFHASAAPTTASPR